MDENIEDELLAMLSEPTAEKVMRDQIKADRLLIAIGRAFTPAVNAMLADLSTKLHNDGGGSDG